MNIQKLIAIVAAILINCAALAWFNAVGAHAVASATPASADPAVVTLPTTTVRPTRAQLEMLRKELIPPVKPDGSV
ncbi:MAG: hypothetical protein JSR56_05665 [Proteobacteria bacterium]|nr:hypothetical protein [Pseudomonadota bacterium]